MSPEGSPDKLFQHTRLGADNAFGMLRSTRNGVRTSVKRLKYLERLREDILYSIASLDK
jgi:hypothetical protein